MARINYYANLRVAGHKLDPLLYKPPSVALYVDSVPHTPLKALNYSGQEFEQLTQADNRNLKKILIKVGYRHFKLYKLQISGIYALRIFRSSFTYTLLPLH